MDHVALFLLDHLPRMGLHIYSVLAIFVNSGRNWSYYFDSILDLDNLTASWTLDNSRVGGRRPPVRSSVITLFSSVELICPDCSHPQVPLEILHHDQQAPWSL